MTEVALAEWNQFLTKFPHTHLLQMGEWGELKKDFGWKPIRIISENVGVQILFRRLPLGFTIAYMPKVASDQLSTTSDQFWREVDSVCKKNRAIFLKLEPDTWTDEFITHHSSFIISKHNIQPPRTITLDINASEENILSRML